MTNVWFQRRGFLKLSCWNKVQVCGRKADGALERSRSAHKKFCGEVAIKLECQQQDIVPAAFFWRIAGSAQTTPGSTRQ
jgi:hypothetical protein